MLYVKKLAETLLILEMNQKSYIIKYAILNIYVKKRKFTNLSCLCPQVFGGILTEAKPHHKMEWIVLDR